MIRVPATSLLVPVAVLSGGLMLAEGWWLWRSHEVVARELKAWEKLKQERDWLAHQVPALTPQNQAALAADVAAATRVVAEFNRMLAGDDASGAKMPAGPTAAFFELADFVGRMRSLAGQAQVLLAASERFGFGAYATAGPAVAQVAAVHRQCRATEYVLARLFEARPQALVAVRRERLDAAGSQGGRDLMDETLPVAPRCSVREPGRVESEALQLEFTGDTAVLRNFLNRLAAGPWPAVVCSVEVEPLTRQSGRARPLGGAGLEQPAATSEAASSSPLTGSSRSKFTVIVEMVRVVELPVAAVP